MLLDCLSIKENIMFPHIIAGKADNKMEKAANRLCEIFVISHIQDKYPTEISGSEHQRTYS